MVWKCLFHDVNLYNSSSDLICTCWWGFSCRCWAKFLFSEGYASTYPSTSVNTWQSGQVGGEKPSLYHNAVGNFVWAFRHQHLISRCINEQKNESLDLPSTFDFVNRDRKSAPTKCEPMLVFQRFLQLLRYFLWKLTWKFTLWLNILPIFTSSV